MHLNHITPRGSWQVLLEASYCKVKHITVNPYSKLSYQKHFKREEHWTIVQGTAKVTLNDVVYTLNEGDMIHIPKEALHRISNETEFAVIFIEVQRGVYFGEDDIVRVLDDYGRV